MAKDRSKPLSSYPTAPFSHPSPAMSMPPPLESSHHPAAAAATTAASDQRRIFSNHYRAPPAPPTHGYPGIPSQELPQLRPNGPYGHPSSLPGSATTAPNAHHHHLPPPSGNYWVNDTVAGAPSHPLHHEAPQYSAPLEYINGEPSGHSTLHTQYPTPVPAPILQAQAPLHAPHQSHAHGMRSGKALRAEQACEQCRLRKTKCDEGKPCSHCEENKLPCVYKSTGSPDKPDKTTMQLLKYLQHMEDRIDEWMTQFQSIQVKQGSELSRISLPEDPVWAASQKQVINPMIKPHMPDVLRDQGTKKSTSSVVNQDDINATEGVEEGLKDNNRKFFIPVEHTTAAHKLLMWPSIKALIYPKVYDEDYVMKLEDGRGLIRVYGQGESDHTIEGTQQGQQLSMPNTSSHSMLSWDEGSSPAFSLSGAAWGAPDRANPATLSTSMKTAEHGIEESGIFTTDSNTVYRLYLSYIDNLHKLHPFLDQNDLKKKINM